MALRSWENMENVNLTSDAAELTGRRQAGADDCTCQLEQLATSGEFERLLHLLYGCLWQRFSLSADEYPLDSSGRYRRQLAKSDKLTAELHFGAGFDDDLDKENICTGQFDSGGGVNKDRFGETPKFELGKPGQQVMEWEFECDLDTVRTGQPLTSTGQEGKINMATYYPVPAWFLLSAVFTGCPQLIDLLLGLQDKAIAPEKIEITQVCLESERDTSTFGAGGKDSQTTDITAGPEHTVSQTSSTSSTYPELQCGGSPGASRQVKISNHMAEIDVRKLRARRFGCHSFVDARVACEFPITDTWIHQSINMMLSPLHLACWRLDYNAIRTLLQHGADPNGLALEQVPPEFQTALQRLDTHGDERPSPQLLQDSPYFLYNGLYFYHNRGLTPLHFIALGLRSPPRHSALEGCRAGIIHDACATFLALQRHESTSPSSMVVDAGRHPCVMLSATAESRMGEELEATTKCAMVVGCLEILLQSGANANLGDNSIFQGAYPMDIILQPPCLVYYAPNAARGTQSSVSLRRYDLELNVNYVIAACETLLRHDAKVSPRFAAIYSWRPELLDSFHLADLHSSAQLVRQAIRLGLFPDSFADEPGHTWRSPSSGLLSVRASAMIQRFIADVMNKSVPASLSSLILHWSSLPLLHQVNLTVAKIAESSGWSENLRELAKVTSGAQLRSLKHSCNFVILRSVGFSYAGVTSLPLPPRLIRELVQLYF